MTDFRFRLARQDDAIEIETIGPVSFAETYGHLWCDGEAYADHLATMGSTANATFIARSDARIWLVERGNRIVGFLSLVMNKADPIEQRPGGGKITQIYLLSPVRGRGLAATLVAMANDDAWRQGAAYLWLDVMKVAPWQCGATVAWVSRRSARSTFPAR